jgi:hypothetical protein
MMPRGLLATTVGCALAFVALSAEAFECPRPTQQLATAESSDVRSSVSELGGLKAATFEMKADVVTRDVFAKYPHADDVAIANTMISMFCQVVLPSAMSDSEKLDYLFRLDDRITRHARVSVPLSPAVGPACSTSADAVLAPIHSVFKAWDQLDVELYLAQWGPDAIARSKYYAYKIADFAPRRRAAFASYQAVKVISINPSVTYSDATKANVNNTYTMRFESKDGRVVDERDVSESYVLESVAKDHSWRIRENNDYQ